MTYSVPFGRTPRSQTGQYGRKNSIAKSILDCKTCSSRIALDEHVLQICDDITENVEERVNLQKALFELETAEASNRSELARREKIECDTESWRSKEERTKNLSKLEKLRE